jgi:hypothetical protein
VNASSQVVQTAVEFARVGSLEDGSRTGTIVVTIGVYTLTLVVGARAVWLARRGRFVGIGCLVGAFVVSWGEPIYDAAFHLAFYARDMTLWSPFGIDQPWWVPPGYTGAYGLGGWLVAEAILRGNVTRGRIARFLVVAWIGCAGFETIAYHLGVLRYFDNATTVWGMPYWHEMFNAVFILIAGIAIAAAQPLLRGAGPFTQLAVPTLVYVLGFTGVTYGAGFLALDAHNSTAAAGWVAAAAVASNVIALLMLLAAVDLLGAVPAYRDGLATGPRLLRFTIRSGPGRVGGAVAEPASGQDQAEITH